jgi:hypothetical protein
MNPVRESKKPEILIYQNTDGKIKIDVMLDEETVWLTQKLMAQLFQMKPQNITIYLKNVYLEGELSQTATCKEFLQVQTEGGRKVERKQKFYNLDAILSIGYRIKSQVATQFRIWATQSLKDYIVKGFALNDERFKSGSSMNYLNELQERIRQIRLSERFFYQKVKDIYTTSIDYDPRDENTVTFFKKVQNKLPWAISAQTAAELVYRRADGSLPCMGMQSLDKTNEVKTVVDDKARYTDWSRRDDIKAELKADLIILLAENGYLPVDRDEVYKEIFEQAENFKKYQKGFLN